MVFYILSEEYYDYVCGEAGRAKLDSVEIDGNPALHLSLASAGFTKYKERACQCC